MRRPLVLLIFAGTLAACGGAHRSLPPSGFLLGHAIGDRACNRGRGVRVAARFASDGVIATGSLAGGSTIVALSNLYPGRRFALLHSFGHDCLPDDDFGTAGVAKISVPSAPRPRQGTFANPGLWISVLAAAKHGGALVAGTYGGSWIVGEITSKGRLDSSFGDRGWALLPFPGDVTAVQQERSGRIVIAGDSGGGGCCNRNWAGALTPSGHLDRAFGNRGRQELPTGEDSGVNDLAVEPNGDILASVIYGNMGCWGEALEMLTPSGRPVPFFAARLRRFWESFGFGAFIGDVVPDRVGFTLVGTGQPPCAGGSRFSASSARGVIARFRSDGEARRVRRFTSPLYGDIRAFGVAGNVVAVESPYADSTHIVIRALWPARRPVELRTPWRGPNAPYETTTSIARSGPRAVVNVATNGRRNELQIIRVRLLGRP